MPQYDPITGELLPESNAQRVQNSAVTADKAQSPLPAETLAALETMGRDELLTIFKRIYSAGWGKRGLTGDLLITMALKTPEEVSEAFKIKLAAGGFGEDDMFKALPIMKEWFDRSLGKAAQSIAVTVKDEGLGKLSDARLLRLESELAKMTGQDAVLILPEPKKLEQD